MRNPNPAGQKHLSEKVHLALDELRMLMLGTQVLFGFSLESAFQERFSALPSAAKLAAACCLALLVVTLALLLAAPAQLRIVEEGHATRRIHRVATRFAEVALATFALALGCAFTVAMSTVAPDSAILAGVGVAAAAVLGWYALGVTVRIADGRREKEMPMASHGTPLHVRIDQMLTEARVILPGAQAVLGFQLLVALSRGFEALPFPLKLIHLAALSADMLAVILLIAPAAVHRLAFFGEDDERFLAIGSTLVTVALVPLSAAISADVYVAVFKMLSSAEVALGGAIAAILLLLGLWYGLPLVVRRQHAPERVPRAAR